MSDIKLTRWATYLAPGSVVVYSLWLLIQKVAPKSGDPLSLLPDVQSLQIFFFFLLSYIIGIGLWGVGYWKGIQRWLGFNSHRNRLKYIKRIVASDWCRDREFSELQKAFPELERPGTYNHESAYHDFELAVLRTYTTQSAETKDRIIQDRETVGLLQTLILGMIVSAASFVAIAIRELLRGPWQSALLPMCAALAASVVTLMLYVHYHRRQYYLVRDVIMAFLCCKEGEE